MAKRVFIGKTQVVNERCVVKVCVEMHHVHGLFEGPHDRIGDAVIAP